MNQDVRDVRNKPVMLQVENGYVTGVHLPNGSIHPLNTPVPATKENADALMSRANYGSLEVYVNVWDCLAFLVVGEKTEDDFNLSPEQRAWLELVKEKVIYADNGGAINMSGLYYPALETLSKIVEILGLAEPAPR